MEGNTYNSPIEINNRGTTNPKDVVDLWETQILIHVALKEIDKYRVTQNKLTQLENDYSRAQQSFEKFKKSVPIWGILSATIFPILVFVAIFIILIFGTAILTEIFSLDTSNMNIELLVYPVIYIGIFFALLTLPLFLVIYFFEKRNWKNKLAQYDLEYEKCHQYKQELILIQKNIVQLKNQLNRSILPHDYQNPYAVDWIVKAVENKRADTLKEAINLFEQHKMAEEIKTEIRHWGQSVVDILSNLEIEVNNYY